MSASECATKSSRKKITKEEGDVEGESGETGEKVEEARTVKRRAAKAKKQGDAEDPGRFRNVDTPEEQTTFDQKLGEALGKLNYPNTNFHGKGTAVGTGTQSRK